MLMITILYDVDNHVYKVYKYVDMVDKFFSVLKTIFNRDENY